MKVLLTTLNSKYIHSSLALRYLRAYGRAHGKAYEMVEYTINMPILDVLSDITKQGAQVIGFLCYIWNIDRTMHLISMIKSVYPDTIIVVGGPEVSYTADEILLSHPYVDYVLQGEGEEAFYSFVKAVEEGADPLSPIIPGIRGRQGEGLAGSTEVVEVADLGSIPFPYDEEDMSSLAHKIVYYESSRGCPFRCQYCLSGNRNTVRFFPLERTLQELQWFMDHGVKQVKFVDRTFNCRKDHHMPILDFITKAETSTNFHLEMESILLGQEEVDILCHSPKGRIQIEVGVQSTHEKTLQAVHRVNDWEHMQEVMTPIIAAGRTHVHMDLIVGLPHENRERFAVSFNDLFSLQPHALQLGFLKLLKGSGVRNAAEYAYIADPKAPYEVLQTHVMPYEDIRFLKHFEDVFERFYNSERYRTVFGYVSRRILKEGSSAFSYFEAMTEQWLQEGNHEVQLNDKSQIAFLLRFFAAQGDGVAVDLLRYDALCSFQGKIQGDELGLPKQTKERMQETEMFWKDEALAQQYIPTYTFKEWRRIRQQYSELMVCRDSAKELGVSGLETVTSDSVRIIIDVYRQQRPFLHPLAPEGEIA